MKLEREFHVKGIATLLTVPKVKQGKVPLILMVQGSGPLDRNGNTRFQTFNVMNELSDEFVKLGYATLRFDKRGIGKSDGNYYEVGLFDLIADVQTLVKFAKKQTEIDGGQIILLGHSEGAMIAPAVAKDERVAGMILLAGLTESLDDAVRWQLKQLTEDLDESKGLKKKMIKLFKVKEKIEKDYKNMQKKIEEGDGTPVRLKGKKVNIKWWQEHRQYDLKSMLQKVSCPVLAIVGNKDIQVKPEQTIEMKSFIKSDCETHIIDDLTHTLRKTNKSKQFQVMMKDYKKQVKKPIDSELMVLTKDWLKKYF